VTTDTDAWATAALELGVFARVFPPGPPDEVAAASARVGFTATQLNLSALGRPTLDHTLTDGAAIEINAAFAAHGVRIWGLSGTFNTIDPDRDRRWRAIDGCRHLIGRAGAMGADVVTLCSGTRDRDDMWRAHPDNSGASAWADLLDTLAELLPVAAATGVRLGIEPEPGNVVRDAPTAARLLRDAGADADHLAIVLDPANLLSPETLPQQEHILTDAFARLGQHVVGIHAKDVVGSGYSAAGAGGMDYDLVLRLHSELPHPVPVIAQDLTADDAARVHDYLRSHVPGPARTGA